MARKKELTLSNINNNAQYTKMSVFCLILLVLIQEKEKESKRGTEKKQRQLQSGVLSLNVSEHPGQTKASTHPRPPT